MVSKNHMGRCFVLWNVMRRFLILKIIHVLSFILDPMVSIDHRGKWFTKCENLINVIVDNYGQ